MSGQHLEIPEAVSPAVRVILIISGSIAVFLGLIGIFLPVLPTTPFLLLAAACYARSSQQCYRWLLTNRWFGEYIRDYRDGRGIRLRHKLMTITLLWVTIGISSCCVPHWWIRILLWCIAAAVTAHLIMIQTRNPD